MGWTLAAALVLWLSSPLPCRAEPPPELQREEVMTRFCQPDDLEVACDYYGGSSFRGNSHDWALFYAPPKKQFNPNSCERYIDDPAYYYLRPGAFCRKSLERPSELGACRPGEKTVKCTWPVTRISDRNSCRRLHGDPAYYFLGIDSYAKVYCGRTTSCAPGYREIRCDPRVKNKAKSSSCERARGTRLLRTSPELSVYCRRVDSPPEKPPYREDASVAERLRAYDRGLKSGVPRP